MGYRIVYASSRNHKCKQKTISSRFWFFTAGFFTLFVLVLPYIWPEGAGFLKDMIFLGDIDALQCGYEAFLSALDSGQSVGEGLVVFCEQIILAGNLGA